MSAFKYVLLGGGNAAGYAAKEWAASGKLAAGELCIITEEPVVAYERPALSKGYLFPEGAPRLPGFHTCVGGGGERQAPEWYAERGIKYMTSAKATAVDVAAKKITLASGETVSYEKLILATGARPITAQDIKLPGGELSGVHVLRNEAEASQLVAAIKAVKEAGGQAVVIGGGYIGTEVAAALAMNGVPATIVFPEDRLIQRLLTPTLAGFYEDFYIKKGIKLVNKASVVGLEGADGKVTHVVVKGADGVETKLPASLVVVGIGARANTELVAGQLELAAGGIKVDGTMRTSNPDVYAIGDVAAFPLKMAGGALARQEHVTHARQSAAHAVKAILGSTAEYDYLPFFYSRVFNLSWQFYGFAEGEVVHFGDIAGGKFGAYWVKDGKVVGAFLESGSPEENAAIKKAALERPAAPVDLATLGISFAAMKL